MSRNPVASFIVRKIRNRSWLVDGVGRLARWLDPQHVLVLDAAILDGRRWDESHPHPHLQALMEAGRGDYARTLDAFLGLSDALARIPAQASADPAEPHWGNIWMPALDGVALYGFLTTLKPRCYLEIGSGNSTKFARRAIRDGGLDCRIVSIDPYPRAFIDNICDEVIRKPAETVPLEVYDRLQAGDILYIDGSHRVFMNSDVTALFLDVLPRLKPGVIVHVHDITLPHDYPADWIERRYSEQYLLAAYLLAKVSRFEILMPNWFVAHDPELKRRLQPLWDRPVMRGIATHGCSFWMRVR